MSIRIGSSAKKLSLWLMIAIVVVVVGWFGYKVLSVEGNMSIDERMAHVFGWGVSSSSEEEQVDSDTINPVESEVDNSNSEAILSLSPITSAPTNNCTVNYGNLFLINPNFIVEDNFIATRRNEMVSLSANYGIQELNVWNGDNLMDPEAALHLNDMLNAYKVDYPGHEMQTVSCFRSVGTNCGRLCAATGTSDHHAGLSCDLLDAAYGTSLDTDTYDQHLDWQWLQANSYKYGFINRFPFNWAGGPMSEPANLDENGTTGLYETWHYRYVGIEPATDIATGKYNDGQYDSLEHYLKARGLVTDLENGKCSDY